MAEFGPKLYFRVAFLALLLPLASGKRGIICNMCSSHSLFYLDAFVIMNKFIECAFKVAP